MKKWLCVPFEGFYPKGRKRLAYLERVVARGIVWRLSLWGLHTQEHWLLYCGGKGCSDIKPKVLATSGAEGSRVSASSKSPVQRSLYVPFSNAISLQSCSFGSVNWENLESSSSPWPPAGVANSCKEADKWWRSEESMWGPQLTFFREFLGQSF